MVKSAMFMAGCLLKVGGKPGAKHFLSLKVHTKSEPYPTVIVFIVHMLTVLVDNTQAVSLHATGDHEQWLTIVECLLGDDHACIGWGGGELWVRPFEVLAYSTSDRR